MQESFELLEQRIRKAADLVQQLRGENARLGDELDKARKRAAETDKRGAADKKGAATAEQQGRIDTLLREVAGLREEREEIRRRLERLVSLLDTLD